MKQPIVIKVGGSLLTEPGTMGRVAEWLAATKEPDQTRLLVAGGGAAVKALRTIDAANPLPDAVSHAAAIEIMDASTRLLASWFPEVTTTDSIAEIEKNLPGKEWAFCCSEWLRQTEPTLPGERLATGWQTTSDAIAGRLAMAFGARLVLLKHTLERGYDTLDEAAGDGVVDSQVARITMRLNSIELIGVVHPGLAKQLRRNQVVD